MALQLSAAEESDAVRIANIHVDSFLDNVMLHAQFPTQESIERLRIFLADETLEEIRDPNTAVLVVRDEKDIISFAKWSLPELEPTLATQGYPNWPEGANVDVLNTWVDKVTECKAQTRGNTPCYYLSFICTDPAHQRRGAATLLMEWGVTRCQRENMPAYLESTDNGRKLYESYGFRAETKIEMELKGMAADGSSVFYSEESFVFKPQSIGA